MRKTTMRSQQLPLELQQQIDRCCDQFESALQDGGSPDISQWLEQLPPEAHMALRREFAAIELAYEQTQARRDSQGLHLRCPHCQNQVELLADAKLEDITCNSCGDSFSLIDDENATGGATRAPRVAHFELLAQLGTGGFGSVWEARDTELDRLVAIKLPRKSQLSSREAEQFFREARAAAQLKHPNIVPVHEVGKDEGTIFIVTDLIRGVSLSERLKETRLAPRETVELCATVAETLDYAHSRGVIHRDLKPSNIMLDRKGQPHVMDFGLAKRELGEITMTVDGTVLGTPAYMSPEQALGKTHWVDRRTDIYSIGVMLFQMLTGELPYRGTAQQQIQQRVVDDAPDPRKLNHHIPADLATICLKCLERDANRRFSTSADLAAELRRYLAGEPIKSRPISSLNRLARWAKRKPALATAAALTAVLAIAGPLAAVTIYQDKQRIEAQNVENDRVINKLTKENDGLDVKLAQATQELDDIRQADSGAEERSDWHRKLIAEFIEANQSARQQLLDEPPAEIVPDLRRQARSHLAWQHLLAAADDHTEAVRHGSAARKLLETLIQQQPNSVVGRLLLATSLTELSEAQHAAGQAEDAAETAKQAKAQRTHLATADPDEVQHRLAEFYAAMNLAKFDTIPETGAGMQEWLLLKRELRDHLAVEPDDLYRVACFLTQNEHLPLDFAPVAAGQTLEDGEVE